MGDTEWPPEGTRVRIVDELDPYFNQVGLLRRIPDRLHVVEWRSDTGKTRHWPVERHEIEVIKQEGSQ